MRSVRLAETIRWRPPVPWHGGNTLRTLDPVQVAGLTVTVPMGTRLIMDLISANNLPQEGLLAHWDPESLMAAGGPGHEYGSGVGARAQARGRWLPWQVSDCDVAHRLPPQLSLAPLCQLQRARQKQQQEQLAPRPRAGAQQHWPPLSAWIRRANGCNLSQVQRR